MIAWYWALLGFLFGCAVGARVVGLVLVPRFRAMLGLMAEAIGVKPMFGESEVDLLRRLSAKVEEMKEAAK